jgi:hypothetical protein
MSSPGRPAAVRGTRRGVLGGLRVGAALRPAGVAEHSFWAAAAVRSASPASSPVTPCTGLGPGPGRPRRAAAAVGHIGEPVTDRSVYQTAGAAGPGEAHHGRGALATAAPCRGGLPFRRLSRRRAWHGRVSCAVPSRPWWPLGDRASPPAFWGEHRAAARPGVGCESRSLMVLREVVGGAGGAKRALRRQGVQGQQSDRAGPAALSPRPRRQPACDQAGGVLRSAGEVIRGNA